MSEEKVREYTLEERLLIGAYRELKYYNHLTQQSEYGSHIKDYIRDKGLQDLYVCNICMDKVSVESGWCGPCGYRENLGSRHG